MQKLDTKSKITLYLLILASFIWLGNTFSRMLFSYHIFADPELNLKSFLNPEVLNGVFLIHQPLIAVSLIFYVVMIILFLSFIIISKQNLKENGWLFISLILVIITFPFEVYLLTYDFKFFYMLYFPKIDVSEAMKIVLMRYSTLGSFMIVELLSYSAIICLFLFQPLTKKIVNET